MTKAQLLIQYGRNSLRISQRQHYLHVDTVKQKDIVFNMMQHVVVNFNMNTIA